MFVFRGFVKYDGCSFAILFWLLLKNDSECVRCFFSSSKRISINSYKILLKIHINSSNFDSTFCDSKQTKIQYYKTKCKHVLKKVKYLLHSIQKQQCISKIFSLFHFSHRWWDYYARKFTVKNHSKTHLSSESRHYLHKMIFTFSTEYRKKILLWKICSCNNSLWQLLLIRYNITLMYRQTTSQTKL